MAPAQPFSRVQRVRWVGDQPSQRTAFVQVSSVRKGETMLKHLLTRRLASWRSSRRNLSSRRPTCRLTAEALEDRFLLSGDMVLRWNEILWQAEWTAGIFAPVNSRVMAITQAAVYEAVNSIDGTYTPYLVDIPAPAFADKDAAVATAAHDALVGLFPAQAGVLDLQLKASLDGIKDGEAKSWGISVGHAAAQIMLAVRAHDGSDKVVAYVPGTNPGDFRPSAPPAAPQWAQVTP